MKKVKIRQLLPVQMMSAVEEPQVERTLPIVPNTGTPNHSNAAISS